MASKVKTKGSLARLLNHPPEVSFLLFADVVDTQPTAAHVPCRALRELGREGKLREAHIGPLLACLSAAPDATCIIDLSKALASLGRKAQEGAPFVIKRLDDINVVDDLSFWTFDTLLFVLGYLGGPLAQEALARVAEEDPPRPLRAKDLYRGEWEEEIRAEMFASNVARAQRMAAIPDDKFIGGWTTKQTEATLTEGDDEPPPKMSPWMTR